MGIASIVLCVCVVGVCVCVFVVAAVGWWIVLSSSCVLGAFGYDFTSDVGHTEEAIQSVAKAVLQHGVTAFCPTVVSSLPSVYHKVVHLLYFFALEVIVFTYMQL